MPLVAQTGYIYVGQAYNGKVAKINPLTNSVVAEIVIADSIGTADHSVTDLVVDTVHNWLFVSCSADNSIGVIDLNTWTATYPLPSISGLGLVPIGLAINSDASQLYVTTRGTSGIPNSTNPLEIYNIVGTSFPPSLVKVTEVPVGSHPINVMLSHNEQYAIVSCRNEPSLVVVDLTTNTIVFDSLFTNPMTEPEGLAIHPTENIIYCTNHGANSISILDLNLLSIVNTVTLPPGPPPAPQPSGGMFSPDGNRFVLLGQTSNKFYYFNTTDPINPTFLPPPTNCGGFQPHTGVFINDSIAYIPNTNNTIIDGNISYINMNTMSSGTAIPGIFHGPLGMVYVKENSSSLPTINHIDLSLYPNPANEFIILKSESISPITALTITDICGREIQVLNTNLSTNYVIDVKEYPNGIYFLKLHEYNKNVYSSIKFVVSK